MSALAAIHVAKKQLGLDDDTYRALLMRETGKTSAGDMTEAERARVVEAFRRQGFRSALKGVRKALTGKYAGKLQALWIGAYNLGIVRNRDDAALIAFVKRQAGVDHVRFLHDPADGAKAIEALKGWMAREAGVDWSDGSHLPDWMRPAGARIALAQWRILARAGLVDGGELRKYVWDTAKPVDQMADQDWQPVMNALGVRIRKAVR